MHCERDRLVPAATAARKFAGGNTPRSHLQGRAWKLRQLRFMPSSFRTSAFTLLVAVAVSASTGVPGNALACTARYSAGPQQCCCMCALMCCDQQMRHTSRACRHFPRAQDAARTLQTTSTAVGSMEAANRFLGTHPYAPQLLVVWPEVMAPAAHAVCLRGSRNRGSVQACPCQPWL